MWKKGDRNTKMMNERNKREAEEDAMDSFSLTSSKEQERNERKFEMDLRESQEKSKPVVEAVTMPPPNYYDGVEACTS